MFCIFQSFDKPLLSMFSATWLNWFCSTTYAEIPVAVVENEIWVADATVFS